MVKCKDCSKYQEERITPYTTKKECWVDVDETKPQGATIVKVKKIERPSRDIVCAQFFPKKLKRERKKKE